MQRVDTAVKVENLRRTFGDFIAVDGINLEIRKGEVFGFLGPNGAGKSTTIKMLCGLLTPSSGKGVVSGYDIMNESENIKKNIGYMSQKFSLYDDLTVEENIDFYAGIYGVQKRKKAARVELVMEMSGLSERRKAVTKTLSGGFKQRLALGCAILHEPPVIFLDEPTSGVDPVSRRNFWDLIYDMARAGTTIFVTTHYMDEADYCDRLALIYRGRIIAEGTPGGLRKDFIMRKVLEIDVDKTIEALDALGKAGIEASIFGSLLHVIADNEQAVPRLRKILEGSAVHIKKIETIAPSLEDVFVTLIETS